MGLLDMLFGARGTRVQPVHVDDENFITEVVCSKLPVLLDVWSPGCSPCAMLEPILVDLASAYQGRVKVAEMNAAEAMGYAARYGVMGTPTLLFFRKGREVERVVGFVGSTYLRQAADQALLGQRPAA